MTGICLYTASKGLTDTDSNSLRPGAQLRSMSTEDFGAVPGFANQSNRSGLRAEMEETTVIQERIQKEPSVKEQSRPKLVQLNSLAN